MERSKKRREKHIQMLEKEKAKILSAKNASSMNRLNIYFVTCCNFCKVREGEKERD